MISTEYAKELDKVMALARLALTSRINLELLRAELSKLETLAPMFAPSEWMRGGADNLDQQRILIEGVAPFLRACQTLREKGAEDVRRRFQEAVREAEGRAAFGEREVKE